jgi:glyoxylase-like metal-dependent hydrolase (beta-lactamase superfamily II)/8-oxo-dGTP pyrophosphatase MutT (NUDIX family)
MDSTLAEMRGWRGKMGRIYPPLSRSASGGALLLELFAERHGVLFGGGGGLRYSVEVSEPSLYERALAAGGSPPPPRAPRASAAIVLWRRTGERLELFWVRRARSMAFMGGWYAFPGGGLGRADAALALGGEPSGLGVGPPRAGIPEKVLDGVGDLGPEMVPGLVTCALRELFEETGVLPLKDAPPAALSRAKRALLAGETSFGEVVADLNLEIVAERLVYAGRWLTPPLGPLRFDNRFFLLEWSSRSWQPVAEGGEAEIGEWIEPRRALARWRRGELLTAPPILHILTVLAEDGPQEGLDRLLDPSEANLGSYRCLEFSPGVVMFPLPTPTLPPASRTNTFLLGTGDAVLVDPGCPHEEELERLLASLVAAREQMGRRVVAIWLTHHHPDHVGGLEWMRRELACPVLCHPLTAERLAERGVAVDGSLAGGERIALGENPPFALRVLHTPGHARGHLCFLEETRDVLIAGDMVAGFGTIVIDPPEGDMTDYLESLDRLADLRPRFLFPAHGPVSVDAEEKLRAYASHRRWREERVIAVWEGGLREPSSMLDEVYPELASSARPLAERQIVAHLTRLERMGRLL